MKSAKGLSADSVSQTDRRTEIVSICFLFLKECVMKYILYRCTVHSVVYLITHTNICIYTYYLRSLKFTLKHLKRSYMFRPHDLLPGAYIVPC